MATGAWAGVLDHPLVWRANRVLLNAAFGLYRRRIRLLRRWGLLEDAPGVLDIGCGIGQYAEVSRGPYLGVDLNERYIRYAARRTRPGRAFRCADVRTLHREQNTYGLVLMVDFLHHLPDDVAETVLREAWRLSAAHVVSFEPVRRQTNPVGQWIIDNDRGEFMRPLDELHGLFERAGLPVAEGRPLSLGPILTRAILCRKAAAARRAA